MNYTEARKRAIYKYRLNNLEKCRIINKKSVKKKYQTNEQYRLQKQESSRLHYKWISNMNTAQSSMYCMRFLF